MREVIGNNCRNKRVYQFILIQLSKYILEGFKLDSRSKRITPKAD
jgi:hypothetical protein